MRKKYGKFYADWRDARGVRHAKAFTTKKAALSFQTRMQREAAAKRNPKSARRSQRSATSAPKGEPRATSSSRSAAN